MSTTFSGTSVRSCNLRASESRTAHYNSLGERQRLIDKQEERYFTRRLNPDVYSLACSLERDHSFTIPERSAVSTIWVRSLA
jgi:hypothetical protein